jgi:hypothetical protein
MGAGIGAPVNVDIAVASYTPLFNGRFPGRDRYVYPRGVMWALQTVGLASEDDIINLKRNHKPQRVLAAVNMTNEIVKWGLLTSPWGPIFATSSIGKLWSFVDRGK